MLTMNKNNMLFEPKIRNIKKILKFSLILLLNFLLLKIYRKSRKSKSNKLWKVKDQRKNIIKVKRGSLRKNNDNSTLI